MDKYIVKYTYYIPYNVWELELVFGTRSHHGYWNADREFVLFKNIDNLTVTEETETKKIIAIPFSCLNEALEDIKSRNADFNFEQVRECYRDFDFGLTPEEKKQIVSFLIDLWFKTGKKNHKNIKKKMKEKLNMYKVKRLCFDCELEVLPYEDNPTKEFISADAAWEYAIELANAEVDDLNADCADGVSFGIPEDNEFNKKMLCKVQYYYAPEGDDTGNTEDVTHYWVCKC